MAGRAAADLDHQQRQAGNAKLKGDGKWCAPFTAELQAAVDAVREGKESQLLGGALARDALGLCYAEAKSILSAKPVAVA